MSSIADLLGGSGTFDAASPGSGRFVIGTVTDNGEKKSAGQVKVEFTAWKSGQNVCQWIPLLRPYAGKNYGSYLVPEVGDIVLIGFLGADGKRPFVLGSFFPADAAMETESFQDKNTLRRLKTKAGIELKLDDEKGKESISAVTPKGLTAVLGDEKETISIQDKNGDNALTLDCKNGEITLTGKKKITITAGKCKIIMDGQQGALTIQCDRLSVKAAQQATIASDQMMTVSGNVLKAEGKQTAQFKGGAMTEVSGGMVKIN